MLPVVSGLVKRSKSPVHMGTSLLLWLPNTKRMADFQASNTSFVVRDLHTVRIFRPREPLDWAACASSPQAVRSTQYAFYVSRTELSSNECQFVVVIVVIVPLGL